MIHSDSSRKVLVSTNNYSICNDNRRLIPFIEGARWGLLNRNGEIVINAQYDGIFGECYSEQDYLIIMKYYTWQIITNTGKVQTYIHKKYGLVDGIGREIIAPEMLHLHISDDNSLVSICKEREGYGVIDINGNIIIPFGKYSYIDGFDHGFARVKQICDNGIQKWGIINAAGETVLPTQYDNIWNFYGKSRESTLVQTFGDCGTSWEFFFPHNDNNLPSGDNSCCEIDDYSSHYGEYGGTYAQDYMGYSDEVINDAFEGDPDACWNVD